MKLHNALLISCCFAFAPLGAIAKITCTPTAKVSPAPYPGIKKIGNTNHLAKPAGHADRANGEQLYIEGTLLDKDCHPIRDARIELWHATPKGKHRYASSKDTASTEPVFMGAGRTYSTGDGSFHFTTLFPGVRGKRTPYVNIRVSSPDMKGVFQTRLYFKDDIRNDKDSVYRRISTKRKIGRAHV